MAVNNAVCFNIHHDAPRTFITGVFVFNLPMIAANDDQQEQSNDVA